MEDDDDGKNPPAFQFYPRDFLTDENQVIMNPEQCGCYIRLLCHCWIKGSLPNDLKVLQKLCDYTGERFEHQVWEVLKKCFHQKSDRLFQKRLLKEREKQKDFSLKMSEAGVVGNRVRWRNIAKRSLSDPHAIANDRSQSQSLSLSHSKIKSIVEPSALDVPVVYLNETAERNFDPRNKSTRTLIKARFAEGRSLDDFKKVIDKKVLAWKTDDRMAAFLRPSTLFRASNFENYLNEPENQSAKDDALLRRLRDRKPD